MKQSIKRIDVFDLASESDLQRIERIINLHPNHTIETIYSPYILLVYRDGIKAARVGYFERQSKEDMKQVENIMNGCEILFKDMNIMFPFAKVVWEEKPF